MVPVADLTSADAINDSFLLSNAVPQNPQMNSGVWRKLENSIRTLSMNSSVIVFTGPLFDCPETRHIGAHNVAVPCAIFKAVLVEKGEQKAVHAVVVPNDATATGELSDYAVSLTELQRRSGFEFFAIAFSAVSAISSPR